MWQKIPNGKTPNHQKSLSNFFMDCINCNHYDLYKCRLFDGWKMILCPKTKNYPKLLITIYMESIHIDFTYSRGSNDLFAEWLL